MKEIKDKYKEKEFIKELEMLEEYAYDLVCEIKYKSNYEIVDRLLELIKQKIWYVENCILFGEQQDE